MKCKETIDKIIKGGKIYQTAEELSEIMNESFKSVFTVEGQFIEPNMTEAEGVSRRLWCRSKMLADC